MGQSKQNFPDAPNYSREYEKGLKVYLKYLPKMQQRELDYRKKYDPQYIEQAMGIQKKYGPDLYQSQLDALQQLDPEWVGMHKGLGDKIQEALKRGYIDPRQEAAYNRWSQTAGQGDPTRDKLYAELGGQYRGDIARGGTMSPEVLRQTTQAIMAKQPNLSYGEAQNMAQAVYEGQRGEQLKQTRQQGAGQFLQTQTPEAQREASLANFYGQAPPEALAFSEAGRFLQPGMSTTNMVNQVGGVTPPTQNRYVYPGAGYQGANFALQNYQNLIAQGQGQGGGSSNPWMNALQGAGAGASMGSVGGPYGAAGGAITGGVIGAAGYPQFSDARLKKNISRTGLETVDGIPIVEFDMAGKRWRGVLAQEVLKVRPDAVVTLAGARLGVFYSKLGTKMQEVN